MDPDKHLDLQTLGWDKCTAAMEEAISSDKAEPIFKAAADKFQEVAATGQTLLPPSAHTAVGHQPKLWEWSAVHDCDVQAVMQEGPHSALSKTSFTGH